MTILILHIQENVITKPGFILIFIIFEYNITFSPLFKAINKDLHFRPRWSKRTRFMPQAKDQT